MKQSYTLWLYKQCFEIYTTRCNLYIKYQVIVNLVLLAVKSQFIGKLLAEHLKAFFDIMIAEWSRENEIIRGHFE